MISNSSISSYVYTYIYIYIYIHTLFLSSLVVVLFICYLGIPQVTVSHISLPARWVVVGTDIIRCITLNTQKQVLFMPFLKSTDFCVGLHRNSNFIYCFFLCFESMGILKHIPLCSNTHNNKNISLSLYVYIYIYTYITNKQQYTQLYTTTDI